MNDFEPTRKPARTGHKEARYGPVSVCKLCWKSIYGFEERKWVTGANPGMAHQSCGDAEDADEAGKSTE